MRENIYIMEWGLLYIFIHFLKNFIHFMKKIKNLCAYITVNKITMSTPDYNFYIKVYKYSWNK